MGAVTKQANFTLPEDLLEEFKKAVPKGQQSKVVAEALRHELKMIKFRTALEGSFGAWRMDRHPELMGGTRRFVRALRRSSRLKRAATSGSHGDTGSKTPALGSRRLPVLWQTGPPDAIAGR